MQGKNVNRLIARFVAREAVPPGGGLGSVAEFFKDEELRKKVLATGREKALEAILAVKSAPDNPFGNDDEKIAEFLLAKIEEREFSLKKGKKMIREEILGMKAGPELDHLVAVEVMGWKDDPEVPYYDFVQANGTVVHFSKRWSPSTDISCAWEVVEAFDRVSWDVQIVSDTEDEGKYWGVSFIEYFKDGMGRFGNAEADAVPLAICRAALLAVLGEEK